MKLGIVTGVKTSKESGTIIDILGMDGTFYPNVPVYETGLTEVPVASEVPKFDPLIAALGQVDVSEILADAKINTFVLFEEVSVFGRDKYSVTPVRFLKNWAQLTGSVPRFKILPEPGGLCVQAAGTEIFPGGYLYLDKTGNVKMSTGFGSVSLFFENETGKVSFNFGLLEMAGAGFNVKVEKGTLALTKKKYLLNTGYLANTLCLEITNDSIILKQSVSDIMVPNVTVKIDNTGFIEIKNNAATVIVDSTGKISVSGTKIEMKSVAGSIEVGEDGTVSLNGKMFSVALAEPLANFLNSHTHAVSGASTSPPVPLFDSQLFGSKTVKAG